ncbi:MAG: hypothetical protein HYU64_19850 [Armatimonadetes bacterium]|nr:hypothetical protein [Armatimonadota bacterium]
MRKMLAVLCMALFAIAVTTSGLLAMKLTIKGKSGRAVVVNVDEKTTIGELRKKAYEARKLPEKKSLLEHKGRDLKDSKSLLDLGIKEGDVISIIDPSF